MSHPQAAQALRQSKPFSKMDCKPAIKTNPSRNNSEEPVRHPQCMLPPNLAAGWMADDFGAVGVLPWHTHTHPSQPHTHFKIDITSQSSDAASPQAEQYKKATYAGLKLSVFLGLM